MIIADGQSCTNTMIQNEMLNEKTTQETYFGIQTRSGGIGDSCTNARQRLNVNANLISRWKQKLEIDSAGAFPGKGKRTSDQQLVYDQTLIFNTVVDNCLYSLSQFTRRNKLIYSYRRLQYLDPFFAKYWLISPWLKKYVKKTEDI